MRSHSRKLSGYGVAGAAFGAVLSLCSLPVHAQTAAVAATPFEALHGNWSGGGTIHIPDGTNERIRCRATYVVNGGTNLQQNLRCASDSYKFDVKSEVNYSDGKISGSWSEATQNAVGTVSGSVAGDQIKVRVQGSNFGAAMTVTTRGNRQSVTIRPQNMGVKEVLITLNR